MKFKALTKNDNSNVNPKQIDALLAQELNEMSLAERERLYEEIHGVAPPVEESEELIVDSLRSMDEELHKITNKAAYKMAESQSKGYVTSRKFRLMFLRAQRFDAREAAAHMVRHMEGKLELFGEHCLGRPIYYGDLDADDQACLKSGVYQLLPQRDRAGRVVFGFMLQLLPERFYKSTENMLRAFSYTMMGMVDDDEESQRNGWVSIVYFVGGYKHNFDPDLHTRTPETLHWLPVRLTAVHYCSDDVFIKYLSALFTAHMIREVRVRMRIHHGTHTEVQYSLMTFGVPVDLLPVTYDGELKTTNHLKWIAKRKAKDSKMITQGYFNGIDLPSDKDILLGRGRTFQDHSGNIKMRQLIGLVMDEYKSVSKEGKVHVTMKVVQELKAMGGRFLQRQNDGWWVEVNDEDARKRVCMSIRTMLATNSIETNSKRFIEHREGKRTRVSPEPENDPCFVITRICSGGHDSFWITS